MNYEIEPVEIEQTYRRVIPNIISDVLDTAEKYGFSLGLRKIRIRDLLVPLVLFCALHVDKSPALNYFVNKAEEFFSEPVHGIAISLEEAEEIRSREGKLPQLVEK